jgi:hypothetical protein
MATTAIDIAFDFRTDANGRDPDAYSPTLLRYHKLLWSRPLPSGAAFDLSDSAPDTYLHHHSDLGEFWLSSDSVIPTFTGHTRMRKIIDQIPAAEHESFMSIAYTIGGMMLFPSNKVDGKQTINGARGFHPSIADRFDLTAECIRRHYLDEWSPLAEVLARYESFFALFDDFQGYVGFFLLNDLVGDSGEVKFFMDFDDFNPPSKPRDVETYLRYRNLSIEFIHARNRRIQQLGF